MVDARNRHRHGGQAVGAALAAFVISASLTGIQLQAAASSCASAAGSFRRASGRARSARVGRVHCALEATEVVEVRGARERLPPVDPLQRRRHGEERRPPLHDRPSPVRAALHRMQAESSVAKARLDWRSENRRVPST
jgi:Flp pilus assembly protein TadB